MKPCLIDGCGNPLIARGWCALHYKRWKKYGDTSITKIRPKGSGEIHDGYLVRSINGVKKRDHVRIAEAILGKPLPPGAVVHHIDGSRTNNEPSNLVICPDRAYHNLIHARMRALDATGNPNALRCNICGTYEAGHAMRERKNGIGGIRYVHLECERRATTIAREKRNKSYKEAA